MVTATLDGMSAGGMYDLVGGGFHRYSVDDRWLVPHFEKMLYDNALLAAVYLHAWVVTGEDRYRQVVEETVELHAARARLEGGGLASAQDADTDGVEGLTFTWTEEEGVPGGCSHPFEHGRSIIRGELEPELRRTVAGGAIPPTAAGLDDKVLASWNGLALAALAEAARGSTERTGSLRRAGWRVPPRPALDGRRTALADWRQGRAGGDGFLDDYANAAHGLLELHVATGEVRWLLRRTGWPCWPSSCSATRRTAASSSRRGTARSSSPARRISTTTRSHRETRCSPTCCCGWPDLGRRRARAAGGRRAPARRAGARAGAGRVRLGACAHSISGWHRRARSRSSATVDSPVARRALAPFEPRAVVAVGPASGVPLLEGVGSSAAARRYTSASDSPAGRRSQIPTSWRADMRVCLMIEGQEDVTWDDWVALAGACEEHGLDGLFRSDHYSAIVRPIAGALDAWATLAALAVVTTRIRIGTMVSPATFRHPSVLARQALTVDHVSGGRVEVGMGAGWYEREHRENGFDFGDARTRSAASPSRSRSWCGRGPRTTGRSWASTTTSKGRRRCPGRCSSRTRRSILGGTAKPRCGGTRRPLGERVQHRVCDTGGMRCTQSHADCCVCGCRSRSGLVAAVAHDSLRRG